MKIRMSTGILGGGAAMAVSGVAHAVYTGLSCEMHTSVAGHDVYRVYAYFSDANDYFTGCQGSATLGPLVIQSRNSVDTGPGSNFFNPGGTGGNTAPTPGQIANFWGTFVTIGYWSTDQYENDPDNFRSEGVSLSPSFPNFINGNQLANSNIGWFTAGPDFYGRAGWQGDDDPLLRVGVMQLSVNVGEGVRGTVAVNGVNAGGGTFQIAGQTFASFIPAPGTLGILAATGVIGRSRRRRRFPSSCDI